MSASAEGIGSGNWLVIVDDMPPIDCHAHVAPDVTHDQIRALDGAYVFAMTRSLDEAEMVAQRKDSTLVWGCGIHPASSGLDGAFDERRFASLVSKFAVVGEVGLDRRAGNAERQTAVLKSILKAASGQSVLISLHSAGRVDEILRLLESYQPMGAVLHWFLGDEDQTRRAVELGCHFSVNAAMSAEALTAIPPERLLPETDYPATRRQGGGARPGDLANLETKVSGLLGITASEVRAMWLRNLRRLSTDCGALDRLPQALVDLLLVA